MGPQPRWLVATKQFLRPSMELKISKLVSGLEHLDYFPYIGNSNPTDFHIFSEGVGIPPTSKRFELEHQGGECHISEFTHQNGELTLWLFGPQQSHGPRWWCNKLLIYVVWSLIIIHPAISILNWFTNEHTWWWDMYGPWLYQLAQMLLYYHVWFTSEQAWWCSNQRPSF